MRVFAFLFLFICAPLLANEVGLLTGRREAELRREAIIVNEKVELRISTFILDLDPHGKRTLGLLADAAKRGVKVYLNVDGLLRGLPGQMAMLKALEEAGVHVRIYNPLMRHALSMNLRNHMKALIGSDSMISGGRNMTSEYYKRRGGHNYIDVDLLTRGEQVEAARKHFDAVFESENMKKPFDIVSPNKIKDAATELESWRQEAIRTPTTVHPKKFLKPKSMRYVADPPAGAIMKEHAGMHKEIIQMIERSKVSLDIMNPYVFPTPEILKALQDAVNRGVKIRLGSNSAATTNSAKLGIAWDVKKELLIDLGIDVFELQGDQFLHEKTIIRDAEEVFVGSFNLDPRSQNLNMENGYLVTDNELARKLKKFNDYVVAKFMVRSVKKPPISELPLKDRAGACLKRTLHKVITEALYPLL